MTYLQYVGNYIGYAFFNYWSYMLSTSAINNAFKGHQIGIR